MFNLWVLSIKTPLPLTRCSSIVLSSVDLYSQFCDTKLLWTLSNKRLFAPYNQDQSSHHVGWTKQDLIIFKTFNYFSHFACPSFYSHFIYLKSCSRRVCLKFLTSWNHVKILCLQVPILFTFQCVVGGGNANNLTLIITQSLI